VRLVRSHLDSPLCPLSAPAHGTSTRFGRAPDAEMAEFASRRAAELILQLAGGELSFRRGDLYPANALRKKITITRAELLRVMGADVPDKDLETSLSALGFCSRARGSEPAAPRIRCWRLGNATNLPGAPTSSARSTLSKRSRASMAWTNSSALASFSRRCRLVAATMKPEDRLRERLIGLGYHEVLTIPTLPKIATNSSGPPMPAGKARESALRGSRVLRSTGAVNPGRRDRVNLNHGQPQRAPL